MVFEGFFTGWGWAPLGTSPGIIALHFLSPIFQAAEFYLHFGR